MAAWRRFRSTCTGHRRRCAAGTLDQETAWEAVRVSQQEIAPITDVRGSAEYKRLLARQLLIAHFVTLFPERFDAAAFYAKDRS